MYFLSCILPFSFHFLFNLSVLCSLDIHLYPLHLPSLSFFLSFFLSGFYLSIFLYFFLFHSFPFLPFNMSTFLSFSLPSLCPFNVSAFLAFLVPRQFPSLFPSILSNFLSLFLCLAFFSPCPFFKS